MSEITVSAPGRIEIGGNHTDHQNGCVLAAAIDLFCVCRAQESETLRVTGDGFDENSAKLVDGVMAYLRKSGYAVRNFTASVSSDVLMGSGLSSSAAFEVAIGRAISELFNQGKIPPVEIAKAGQYAENVMLRKPSGLLDQTASAVGGLVFIDFKDPQTPYIKPMEIDFDALGYNICVTDTLGSHADLTADYAAITVEMRAVAGFFNKKLLCDVKENEVIENIQKIRARLGDRAVLRALHFFSETNRARQEADALSDGNIKEFLRLINESGDSSFKNLQNAYSLSSPNVQGIPLGLEISRRALGGKGAIRLHGGGFAGTIQAFVPLDLVKEYQKSLNAVFGENACRVLRVTSAVRRNGGKYEQ